MSPIAASRFVDFQWWDASGGLANEEREPLKIRTNAVVDKDWYSIERVEVRHVPHIAKFRRPHHTILLYDRGSFVEGFRRIDDLRRLTSMPLDVGVDVIPALATFEANAQPGSEVSCTLISLDADQTRSVFGNRAKAGALAPCFNFSSGLVGVLADRLRDLLPKGGLENDALFVESALVLLFREIVDAQGLLADNADGRCVGGLSSRAQRIVREVFEERYGEKIDIDQLAEAVGVSRFHFTRAFKASFGVPPYRFLSGVRIRKAGELLRSSDLPVTEIALQVGYSCASEFSRSFKAAMKCSPRDFRFENRALPRLEALLALDER